MFNEMVAGSFKYNLELIFNVKVGNGKFWKMFKVLTSANHSFQIS